MTAKARHGTGRMVVVVVRVLVVMVVVRVVVVMRVMVVVVEQVVKMGLTKVTCVVREDMCAGLMRGYAGCLEEAEWWPQRRHAGTPWRACCGIMVAVSSSLTCSLPSVVGNVHIY